MCELSTAKEYIQDLAECKSFMRDHFNVILEFIQSIPKPRPTDICAMQHHIPVDTCIIVVTGLLTRIPKPLPADICAMQG